MHKRPEVISRLREEKSKKQRISSLRLVFPLTILFYQSIHPIVIGRRSTAVITMTRKSMAALILEAQLL